MASRVKAAKSGINRAIREKKIFHMFTHPINFAYDDSRTDMMLNGMETIFEYACDLRKKNRLDLLNMSQICDLVERN